MNRVLESVEFVRGTVNSNLDNGSVTNEQIQSASSKLDMTVEEHARYQNLKNIAMLNGILNLDEAQTVYAYLGTSVDTFNEQPFEVKMALTKLFAQLLIMSTHRRS